MTMRRGHQQEDVTKAMMQRDSTERNEHKQQNHGHNNHPELSISHTIYIKMHIKSRDELLYCLLL